MAANQVSSEQLVRKHFDDLWNNKNPRSIRETCAPDVEFCVGDEVLKGQQAFEDAASVILGAFPDIRCSIDDLIATPERVVVRWTSRGTHRGEFAGVGPTGRPVEYWGISLYEVRDGKIWRQWGTANLDAVLAKIRGQKPPFYLKKAA